MSNDSIKNEGPREWGVLSVIIFIGLMILIDYLIKWPSMLIYVIVENIFIPSGIYNDELFLFIARIFYQLIIILLIYLIVAKIFRNKLFQSLKMHKVSSKTIVKYAFLTIAFYIAIGIRALVIRNLLFQTSLNDLIFLPSAKDSVTGCNILSWIIGLIPALTASLSEEIVYRGYIFSGLKKRLGDLISIIVVTVLFVYVHGKQVGFSPIHLYSLSVGAIVLGVIRVKSDSLSKCILLHFFFNLFFNIHRIIYLCWISNS